MDREDCSRCPESVNSFVCPTERELISKAKSGHISECRFGLYDSEEDCAPSSRFELHIRESSIGNSLRLTCDCGWSANDDINHWEHS
jgi:hypothetical protein